MQKGRSCKQFKEARGVRQLAVAHKLLGRGVALPKEASKIRVPDLLLVDAHAFVYPQQVGRGVQARAETRSRADRGQRGRRGTLAVGTRDQHRREALLRVAQLHQQRADVIERELARRDAGGKRVAGEKLGAERGECLEGFLVPHRSLSKAAPLTRRLHLDSRSFDGQPRPGRFLAQATVAWQSRPAAPRGRRRSVRCAK